MPAPRVRAPPKKKKPDQKQKQKQFQNVNVRVGGGGGGGDGGYQRPTIVQVQDRYEPFNNIPYTPSNTNDLAAASLTAEQEAGHQRRALADRQFSQHLTALGIQAGIVAAPSLIAAAPHVAGAAQQLWNGFKGPAAALVAPAARAIADLTRRRGHVLGGAVPDLATHSPESVARRVQQWIADAEVTGVNAPGSSHGGSIGSSLHVVPLYNTNVVGSGPRAADPFVAPVAMSTHSAGDAFTFIPGLGSAAATPRPTLRHRQPHDSARTAARPSPLFKSKLGV